MTDASENLHASDTVSASPENEAAINEALAFARAAAKDLDDNDLPNRSAEASAQAAADQSARQSAGTSESDPLPPSDHVAAASVEAAVFDQAGIDALFGFEDRARVQKCGLTAVIESKVINHERLPMLEVVCDRMVRTFSTSMRNLTSDAIDVRLEEITSTRFGDFMNRVLLPAMIGVFNVREWENYGVVTVESNLIYAVVDALLGGRKGNELPRIEGRGFTSIETKLVSKMVKLALDDLAAAFEPIGAVTMELERTETNPRFAAIAGPSNICAVATFMVDMEGRGGRFSVLLPYATLEPVRDKLMQRFMGEKLGRDRMWEGHIASEIRQTEVSVDVVLGEKELRLRDVMALTVGQTLTLAAGPNDPLELHCGGVALGRVHIGRRSNNIAVRILNDVSKGFPK